MLSLSFYVVFWLLFACDSDFSHNSRRSRVYHPQLVAVYHQHEVLYIIKPQVDASWRVMRYKGATRPWWYTPRFARWWYAKPAAWINKKRTFGRQKFSFCWWGKVDSDHRSQWQQIYSLPPLAAREFPHMELVNGVEPSTCWLQISCSAIEPHQQFVSTHAPTMILYHKRFLLSTSFLKKIKKI